MGRGFEMNIPTRAKLEAAMKENPNQRTIMAWLQHRDSELTYVVKRQKEDIRFTQGQLLVLDDLIALLKKDVS